MPLVNGGFDYFRYFCNEAASGSAPTSVADSGPNAYHLDTVDYGTGNMAWIEDAAGKRGLECTTASSGGNARHAINDTSDALRDAIAGAQQITFEVVLRQDAAPTSGYNRFFDISRTAGGTGILGLHGLVAAEAADYQMAWNDVDFRVMWNNTSTARHVATVVIDTTQATQADRARIWVDGSEITGASKTVSLALNDTLTLSAGSVMLINNRASTYNRSPNGATYYAAIYVGALSSTDVTANQTLLASDDDTSGAVAAALYPFRLRR